jgi:hypothetical protein
MGKQGPGQSQEQVALSHQPSLSSTGIFLFVLPFKDDFMFWEVT